MASQLIGELVCNVRVITDPQKPPDVIILSGRVLNRIAFAAGINAGLQFDPHTIYLVAHDRVESITHPLEEDEMREGLRKASDRLEGTAADGD